MRKSFFILSILAFLGGTWAAHAAPLQVLSATPKGSLTEPGRQAITLRFNQPVVALGEPTSFSSDNCPLVLTPKIAGTCRYAGTQTLVFEPAENWPLASQYTAQLPAGFKAAVSGEKLAEAYRFSFTTPRPYVRMVYPQNGEHWVTLSPVVYVAFSQKMDGARVAKHAYLTDPAGNKITLSARQITPEEFEKKFSYLEDIAQVVALSPTSPLQKNTKYTLVLPAGLQAAQGNLGLEHAYQSSFYTYPGLAVLEATQQGCLPLTPQVRFSTPVRMRELVAAAKVSPASAVRKLNEQELDALGYERTIMPFAQLSPETQKNLMDTYQLSAQEQKNGTAFFQTPLSFLNLTPEQSVTVTLDKNLTDIYGNRLGKEYTFTISNNGYCPAVDFSGGYGVLESYLPARLPIEVINTPSVDVRAARFNKENYIPFVEQKEVTHCQPKPLAQPSFEGEYTFKDNKNKTLKTFFDLAKFHPTAQDSLLFSQVKIKRSVQQDACWVQATDNLTDVGITFKTSPQSILLWATSLETGEPLANLAVELRDSTNTILWSGSTDMNGLARAPGWTQLDTKIPSWGQPKLYAFVSSPGGDGFISTELNDGMELWRFNVNYTYNPQQEQNRIFLFTERGVYRPGEKVYLKGVARQWNKDGWSVPQALTGKIVVSDVAGQEILSKTVTASAHMGTFDLSFEVPASARTGQWEASFTMQAKNKEEPLSAYTSFQVETAKPAAFKVTLQPQQKEYLSAQQADFAVTAHYQFGSALTQAPATWSLRREMAWFDPKGYEDYIFVPYFLRKDEYKENGKLLLSSSQKTDEKGALTFTARLPEVSAPTQVFAQVGVQSPARQDLFARTSVMVHPARFYLGAKLLQKYAQQGQPVTADIVAVTPQGKRTQAQVVAQIRQEIWRSVRKVGLSGRLEWVSEKEEIELPSQTLQVPEGGTTFSFTPQQSGEYYVMLTATDEDGRRVIGGFDVTVYGKDGPSWAQRDDDILQLKQDKNTYRPGQKARIQVQSPYDTALALVTVEREGILDAWTTTVKGGADYIEVPIKANYLPNVYVGVTLVKGRTAKPVDHKGVDLGKPQGKMGYVNLNVEPSDKKIKVSVKTNKTQYRPGDEVTVKLTTQVNGKGAPAEVVLYAVDEGVLALSDYKTPDLFDVFYGARALSVFTADNRSYVIGQRNFGEKGENRGGGGSDLAKLGGVDLRSRFSFVPYFNATVNTDAKGRATVRFTLPDNLTRFRIMAVAVRAKEFGATQTQIHVSKPLMITSNLPPIAHVGDQFQCAAVVYNYADKKGVLTVQAASSGALKLADIAAKTVEVPLGQSKEVSWPCSVSQTGPAQVAFSVKSRGEMDGVKTELNVLPVEQQQTLMLYATTDTQQEELIDKPGSVRNTLHNQVGVALSSTALLNLKGALSYLIAYPYDCLEQQMSKIRPVIESTSLVKDFNLADIELLKKNAQEVLNRIEQYQYSTGGYGYWQDALPDPYLTAYVLETAYQARKAGFTVPEKSLQAAAAWLEKAFNKNETRAYSYNAYEMEAARAYTVYVLSLYGRHATAWFNNLYANRHTLTMSASAYLLKAAQQLGRTTAIKQALAQRILNHLVYTPKAAYFDESHPLPWMHGSDVSSTAVALDALLMAKQPFADAFKTVSWLLDQKNAQGHWNSTHENALVLQALQRYYQMQESKTPDFTAQVVWNGIAGLQAHFAGRTLEEKTETLPFTEIYVNQAEQARVLLRKEGQGTLYYTLWQTYEPKAYTRPINAGFEVTRHITTLDGEEVHEMQAGQHYQITLTLRTAAARHFVVAEDFLPAGVEIVNTSLATQAAYEATLGPAQEKGRANDYLSTFERVERYDDRVAAFADYLPAGTHTFTYQVSAVSRGMFVYPSAWVSLMYDPGTFGRNTTTTLTIQ